MITVSVESDEEQWAIGTALVNGALGFGNWPFEVRRVFSGGPGGGGGYSAGGASTSDQRWTFGSPLRSCCATMPGCAHLGGCDEAA